MNIEIELGGNRYSIRKMSALQQFHVSRRIGPIIPSLIPIFLRIKKSNVPLGEDIGGLAEVLQPLADSLSGMKDEDAEYVMSACMSAVQRKMDQGWTAVWSEHNKVCMFDDIDLSVMLPLTVRVITANLGPFISGLLTSQASSPAAPAAAG